MKTNCFWLIVSAVAYSSDVPEIVYHGPDAAFAKQAMFDRQHELLSQHLQDLEAYYGNTSLNSVNDMQHIPGHLQQRDGAIAAFIPPDFNADCLSKSTEEKKTYGADFTKNILCLDDDKSYRIDCIVIQDPVGSETYKPFPCPDDLACWTVYTELLNGHYEVVDWPEYDVTMRTTVVCVSEAKVSTNFLLKATRSLWAPVRMAVRGSRRMIGRMHISGQLGKIDWTTTWRWSHIVSGYCEVLPTGLKNIIAEFRNNATSVATRGSYHESVAQFDFPTATSDYCVQASLTMKQDHLQNLLVSTYIAFPR